MEKYLPTLITLFGSISGILIAFLVLLFNSSKNWLDSTRVDIIGEVKSCFKCRILNNYKVFKTNNTEKWDDIETRAVNDRFSLEHSKTLLIHLQEINKGEKYTIKPEELTHIKKYHTHDLKSAIDSYTSSVNFYNSFPKTVTWSIGIPLLITILFMCLLMFSDTIILKTGNKLFDWVVFSLAISGVVFIFFRSRKTLIKLKELNE